MAKQTSAEKAETKPISKPPQTIVAIEASLPRTRRIEFSAPVACNTAAIGAKPCEVVFNTAEKALPFDHDQSWTLITRAGGRLKAAGVLQRRVRKNEERLVLRLVATHRPSSN